MKPPITIDDHGDISIFRAIEDAEKYVEPIDVASGDLVAYDGEGRLLRGRVVSQGVLRRGVKLEPVEEQPGHALVLRERVTGCLAKLGESRESLEAESLDGLLARGLRVLEDPQR